MLKTQQSAINNHFVYPVNPVKKSFGSGLSRLGMRTMDDGYIKEAKKIFRSAVKEYKTAKERKNELKARQAAEKGYLCLLNTVNALIIKSGIDEEKLPKNERGRTYFLKRYADREFRKSYGSIYKHLHIDAFHERIIDYKILNEQFEELEGLINRVENEF